MLTFQDYLYEAFDFSYNVEYISSFNIKNFSFSFLHNNQKILVSFEKLRIDSKKMEILFTNNGNYNKKGVPDNNTIKLFSTIAVELKKYLKRNDDIKAIAFSNTARITVSLYDAFAKRIAKDLNGKVFKIENPNSPKGYYTWNIKL